MCLEASSLIARLLALREAERNAGLAVLVWFEPARQGPRAWERAEAFSGTIEPSCIAVSPAAGCSISHRRAIVFLVTADEIQLSVLIGLVSGLTSGLLATVLAGIVRTPWLSLKPGDAVTGTYSHGTFRFVHVRVRNRAVRLFRHMLTRPATSCRAVVTIGDVGSAVPRLSYDGRWTTEREPVIPLGGQPGAGVVDQWLASRPGREHLNPDEHAEVAIAVKQEGEAACFAFSSRSYLHQWKNPEWRLEPGTYWLRIDVTAGEVRASRTFTLVNTGTSVRGLEVKSERP